MNTTPLPNHIREFRLQAGLRQQDIADRLGVKVTDRISQWERGLIYPNLVNLFKLCNILNVFPHQIYPDLLTSKKNSVIVNPKDFKDLL